MPKFLITRCTTYDMAGVAMINGAMNGLYPLFEDAEFKALVFPQNSSPSSPIEHFMDPSERMDAFAWADCCIDLGGLVKGYDPYRLEYIKECRKKDIPYIYMAVSFEHPDPEIVRGIPATARGVHSAKEYEKSCGKIPKVVPDISFLINPKPNGRLLEDYVTFTTHKGKPWPEFYGDIKSEPIVGYQVVFKPENSSGQFEPSLGIPIHRGSTPEELYAFIADAKRVYTCRYHAAVAAIMADIPFIIPMGMPNWKKYEDLNSWRGMSLGAIRSLARVSCEYVKEVLHG